MRRKRCPAGVILLVSVTLLALSGCGGGGDGRVVDGTTRLTWSFWSGSSAEVDTWKHIAAMVTEEYPDIELTFRTVSFDDYFTKTAAQSGGGNLPCLLGMQSLRARDFEELFLPLDDVMSRYGIDPAGFEPSIMDSLQSADGEQLQIPYDLGPYVVFYNRTLFEQAGLPPPEAGWTVDDFLHAATALTRDGTYGFAVLPSPDHVNPWALNLGGVQAVDESGDLRFTHPEFVDAMTWYRDLVTEHEVASPVPSGEPTWAGDQWLAGNAAMVVDGPWSLINARATAQFEVGIAPMPTVGGEPSRTLVAGSGFGISRSCQVPEAAAKALSVITGPEAAAYLGEQGRAFPARTAQQPAWYAAAGPEAEPVLSAALESAQPYRTSVGWGKRSDDFLQFGVPVMNGEAGVEEFLQTIQGGR